MTAVLPHDTTPKPRDIRGGDPVLRHAFNLHADATRALMGAGLMLPRQVMFPPKTKKTEGGIGAVPVFVLRLASLRMVEVQRLERRVIPDVAWDGRWRATDDAPELAFMAPHWQRGKYLFIALIRMSEEEQNEYASTRLVPLGGHICWLLTYRDEPYVLFDMRIHMIEADVLSRPGDCVPGETP